MNEILGNNIKETFEFSTQIVKEEYANFDSLLDFLTKCNQ